MSFVLRRPRARQARTALSAAVLACLSVLSAGAAPAPPASGEARVDGQPMKVAHAYLFHAPDSFNAGQVNPVVLLTPAPVATASLKKAATLVEALRLAPERIVVEVRPDGQAVLSICHPAFGGDCYSTTISGPDEWKPAPATAGRLAGKVRIFGGREDTILDKYKLFYEFSFDAGQLKDFAQRR